MSFIRNAVIAATVLAAAACSREQPSGVPELGSAPVPPAPVASAPVVANDPAAPIADAPPPLASQLEAFNKTGYPVCDDFIEEYRQCLNTHLIAEELQAQGAQWRAVGNAVLGNVSRGVTPERIEASCRKARRIALPRMNALGCNVK